MIDMHSSGGCVVATTVHALLYGPVVLVHHIVRTTGGTRQRAPARPAVKQYHVVASGSGTVVVRAYHTPITIQHTTRSEKTVSLRPRAPMFVS